MRDLKKIIAVRRKIIRATFNAVLEEYGHVFVRVVVRSDVLDVATLSHWPDEKFIGKGDVLFCVNVEDDRSPEPVVADALSLSIKNESVTGLYQNDTCFGFVCRFNGIASKVDIPWLAVSAVHTQNSVEGVFYAYPLLKIPKTHSPDVETPQPSQSEQTGNVIPFRPRSVSTVLK